MATTDHLITAIKDLMAIESTAQNPAGLYAAYNFMLDLVRASGKTLTIEEFENGDRPSFLAYNSGNRPDKFDLILNAHVDVVPGKPEQFKPYIENGKLYGRGAYDMKAAAIVLAEIFCEYVNKVPYTLGLQLVTSEESGGVMGTGHQIEQGVRTDLVICGECGRADGTYEIANGAKGVAAVEILFHGRTAHGAYPWRGDNAAAKAAYFVTELWRAYPTPTKPTSGTTITVTGLQAGGIAHNQVPDTATVRVDCRYAPDDPHFVNHGSISEFFHSIDPTAEIVRYVSFGLPAHADANHRLLQALKVAAELVEGHDFSLVQRNGASDGRFYTDVGGQAVEFGVAGSNQHADNENITIKALENYAQTMHTFFQRLATTS